MREIFLTPFGWLSEALDRRVAIGAFAIFMGIGILFLVGFSGEAHLHEFAHDVRHAVGFPCH